MTLLSDPAVQTPAQALQQPATSWQPFDVNASVLPASEQGVWLSIALVPQPDYALQLAIPWLDQLHFYQFDSQGVLLQQWQTGDETPFASRAIATTGWVFPVAEQCSRALCQTLLYVRHTGAIKLLLSHQPLMAIPQQQQFVLTLQFGLLLFAMLLSTLLALLTARADYGWLSCQLLALTLLLLDRTGSGFQWLWPQTPRLNRWIELAQPLMILSSCGLLSSYFQLSSRGWLNRFVLGLQTLAGLWCLVLLWWLWLPAVRWQSFSSDLGVYLLATAMLAGIVSVFNRNRRKLVRAILFVLPWFLLQMAVVSLYWPAHLPMFVAVEPLSATLLATAAALFLVCSLFSQLYLKKAGLSRIQQQLLQRNQQLAAIQQQELLRSRIAPFYQLGSRLALTELLTNQLAQSGGGYRLLLIEFQQFDQLEAVLGRQKTTELLQLYLTQLQQFCQQQSPAVVSLGQASYQTLYALSPARFALLLQSGDFVAVFSKIRALLQQKISLANLAPDFKPRFSSVAVDPTLAVDAEDLLAHGLLALTCADNAEGYLSYQPQLAAQSKQRLALITDLSMAAAQQQLSLSFQPVKDLTSQRIVALEALLRWQHPQHGAVSPAVFIPLAEETGLIHNLTRWVYRQVRQTQDLLFQRGQKLQIAVNLSGYDLENHRLISSILKHEQQYPTAQKVKFELTESAMQRDSVAARQSLALLQRAGAVLVMDDFGAGQSMLGKLMALQIYEIKIDMAMLRMLGTQREIVLAAIIRLAKSMAMRVICEGVESQPQYDFLTFHNVDAVQGYFIARPMPLPQLLQWLNSSAESAPVLSSQV